MRILAEPGTVLNVWQDISKFLYLSKSSRVEMFCKTGKHLWQSLFLKESCRPQDIYIIFRETELLNVSLEEFHGEFRGNVAKFLRTPFLWNTSEGCFFISTFVVLLCAVRLLMMLFY